MKRNFTAAENNSLRLFCADLLRVFAVLAVTAYHLLRSKAPGGFLGVQIFFLLSGFFAVNKLLDDPVAYLLRRLERLYKPLLRALFIFAVTAYFFYPRIFIEIRQNLRDVMLMIFDINRMGSGLSYFEAAAALNPLVHLWTISVELSFCLLAVLIAIFSLKFAEKHKCSKESVFLIICLIGIIITNLAAPLEAEYFYGSRYPLADPMLVDPATLYYARIPRFAPFFFGSLLHLIYKFFKPKVSGKAAEISLICSLLLLPFLIWPIISEKVSYYNPLVYFGGMQIYFLIAGIIFFLFTLFEAGKVNERKALRSGKNEAGKAANATCNKRTEVLKAEKPRKFFAFLADISYGFYLYQFAVQIFLPKLFPILLHKKPLLLFLNLALPLAFAIFDYSLSSITKKKLAQKHKFVFLKTAVAAFLLFIAVIFVPVKEPNNDVSAEMIPTEAENFKLEEQNKDILRKRAEKNRQGENPAFESSDHEEKMQSGDNAVEISDSEKKAAEKADSERDSVKQDAENIRFKAAKRQKIFNYINQQVEKYELDSKAAKQSRDKKASNTKAVDNEQNKEKTETADSDASAQEDGDFGEKSTLEKINQEAAAENEESGEQIEESSETVEQEPEVPADESATEAASMPETEEVAEVVQETTSAAEDAAAAYGISGSDLDILRQYSISYIGDSTSVFAVQALTSILPDFYGDAVTSRHPSQGIEIIRALARNNQLGDILIVALGTNSGINETQLAEIKALAPDIPVFFVTVRVPLDYEAATNASIRNFTATHEGAYLIDWNAASEGRYDLFAEDGYHPNFDGVYVMVNLILNSLLTVVK